MADATQRPVLTMPPEESALLTAAYQAASVILEYGTGGSTLVAADLPGRAVFSVESSADWLARMRGWFAANPPKARVHLHHGDIGKTRDWGYPLDNKQVFKWAAYPISIWDQADFQHPDVVLIDGRFRTACFYTTALRITRPVRVLWDDYAARPNYHQVEEIVGPPRMTGRMAEFDLHPMEFSPAHMALTVGAFLRPG
jgi:SAM-dependent methyltransferase